MRERKVMKLASRGKRLGAFCIDAVVPAVSVLIIFITTVLLVAFMPSYGQGGFMDPYSFGYGYGYGYNRHASAGFVTAYLIAVLLLIAYMVAQMVFFSKSKTIGKAVLGLEVVSSNTGDPIGFWKMLFREWIVKKASESIFLLGYIWVLIDDKNRGWHDKILDTYVVDLKESEALERSTRKKTYQNAAARPQQQPQPSPELAVVPATSPAAENATEAADAVVNTAEEVLTTVDVAVAESNGEEGLSGKENTNDKKVITDEQK